MSPLWTGSALRAATGGTLALPFNATGVAVTLRDLAPGDLFVALATPWGDGHADVPAALAAGAAGVMVHQDVAGAVRALRVDDTWQGLWDLAVFARARFTGRLIAVSGSAGKTTTLAMLGAMLEPHGVHLSLDGPASFWSVALSLAQLAPDSAFAALEICLGQPGDIAALAQLARPHVALVTNIASAGIGPLGSLDAIADEHDALIQALEPGGAAILPEAPARLGANPPPDIAVVRFGGPGEAAAQLTAMIGGIDGSRVGALIGGDEIRFQLGAAGRHMANNAVAALAACAVLGVEVQPAADTMAAFRPAAGRGLRRPILGGRASLLDESDNASPPSLRAALALLRMMKGVRRLAVLGDMEELGDHTPGEHASLAPELTISADLLFACGPNMRHLFDAVPPERRGAYAPDSQALATILRDVLAPGDAVLVKGGPGSAMRRVVAALEQRSA